MARVYSLNTSNDNGDVIVSGATFGPMYYANDTLHTTGPEKPLADKQVYFERRWTPATLLSQKGTVCTVQIQNGSFEIDLPYTHVRDLKPVCRGCKTRIFHNSYQTHEGTSYCPSCYRDLDEQTIQLMFTDYQWLSWDGQMSVRDMDDSHIANTLGMLKRNADQAAELAGGKVEQYLHPGFHHLVKELHRRKPPEEQVKVNGFLLYIWSVLYMVFGQAMMTSKDK